MPLNTTGNKTTTRSGKRPPPSEAEIEAAKEKARELSQAHPFRKRSGTTPVGMLGAAVVSVLLLCGAGNTPTGNLQTSDLNANGHAITNAANIATTNLTVSSAAALPANTTVGGTAVSPALSPVIYHTSTTCASDAGALLNTSLASGASFSGVSDQTAALQAIFNHASTGTPIVVVWDGAYSTSAPITVYGNTRVIALHNCGLVLRNSASCPMFQNAHISTGSGSFGTITDYNISFDGGLWNGNAANQAHDTSTYGWTTGFKFWGVDGLTLDNLRVFDSRTFAFHIANSKHISAHNIRVNQHSSGFSVVNQDGMHFNGPDNYINVDGLTAQTDDDTFALCADDQANNTGITNYTPGYGPITNVHATGINLENCELGGVRLLSGADLIDNVVIDGVHGSTYNYVGVIDNFPGGTLNNPGSGNVNRVAIINVDATLAGSGGGNYNNYFLAGCAIQDAHLDIRAGANTSTSGSELQSVLAIEASATIANLDSRLAFSGNSQHAPIYWGGAVTNWNCTINAAATTSAGQSYGVFDVEGTASGNIKIAKSSMVNLGSCLIGSSSSNNIYASVVNSSFSTDNGSPYIFINGGTGHIYYGTAAFNCGSIALASGAGAVPQAGYNAALDNLTLNTSLTNAGLTTSAGFKDTTTGHTNAPSAFDGSGNIVPITVGSGLTYNTSTKTLTASGGSYSAGTGLTLSGTTFSLTSPVSVANGGTGITSFGTGVATGLAANVNSGSGFETASNAASTFLQLSDSSTQTVTGAVDFSSTANANVIYGNGWSINSFGGNASFAGGAFAIGTIGNGNFQSDAGQLFTDGSGDLNLPAIKVGGNSFTYVRGIKIITGTLASGAATLSDASITTASAIIVTHLGSSVTNAGALFAYPTGTGTGSVKSANASDNDTFTAMVVNH